MPVARVWRRFHVRLPGCYTPTHRNTQLPGRRYGAPVQRRPRFRHRGKHVLHVFRDAVLGAAFQQIRSPTTGTTRLQPQNSSAEPPTSTSGRISAHLTDRRTASAYPRDTETRRPPPLYARKATGVPTASRVIRLSRCIPWVVVCRTPAVGLGRQAGARSDQHTEHSPADVDVRLDWQYRDPPDNQTSRPRAATSPDRAASRVLPVHTDRTPPKRSASGQPLHLPGRAPAPS
jgi:hypothetical protein